MSTCAAQAIDKRFDNVDKQFGVLTETLAELRKYLEFRHSSLEETLNGRFDRFERKLDQAIVARRRPGRRR